MSGQTSRPASDGRLFEFSLMRRVLVVGIVVFSLGFIGTPSSWANSLTVDGVTFNMTVNGSDQLELNILNAVSGGTGGWADIVFLDSFQINNYGTADSLSVTGVGSWSGPTAGGLSNGGAGGCNGSGSGVCFTALASPGFTLTDDFTLTIAKSSGSWNLNLPDNEGGFGPHLKVLFLDASGTKAGSLLSQTVPVPGTALMFGLGMVGLFGWHYRSRSQVSPVNLAV